MYKKTCLVFIIWIGIANFVFCQENSYQPPTYKTGEANFFKYIIDHIPYPDTLKEAKVFANIFISKSGKVVFINAIGEEPAFNNVVREGLRKMPDWNPAFKENKAVDTVYSQLIIFSLGAQKYDTVKNVVEIVHYMPLFNFIKVINWNEIYKKITQKKSFINNLNQYTTEIKDTILLIRIFDSSNINIAMLQYRFNLNETINTDNGKIIYYDKNGQIKDEYEFNHLKKDGFRKEYYSNGQLECDKFYKNDKLHGEQLFYHKNGQLKIRGLWKHGEMTTIIEAYNEIGQKVDINNLRNYISDTTVSFSEYETYLIYERVPKFPGGNRGLVTYLKDNIKYPYKAKFKNIEGKVEVQFMINVDGHVSDVKIIKGLGYGLDEEAIRVVKNMPEWTPGIMNFKYVPVYFNLPIKFSLAD